MNQRVVFHTLSAPEREGDDIQVQLVTIRLGQSESAGLEQPSVLEGAGESGEVCLTRAGPS
jgi:hypothetical protein